MRRANTGTVDAEAFELRKQMEQALAALSEAERNSFRDAALGRLRDRGNRKVLKSSSNATKTPCFERCKNCGMRSSLSSKQERRHAHRNGIMKHMTEEELIAYREGVASEADDDCRAPGGL